MSTPKMKFAPSLMCMDFLKVGEQLKAFEGRADYLHMDLMDGHYCPNLTLGPDFVAAVNRGSDIPMDCHFMTTDPGRWIPAIAAAGVKIISLQAETINTDAFRQLNTIRDQGCEAGIVLNPATTWDITRYYAHRLRMVTVMTVDVGFAGQAFIEEMLPKIEGIAAFKQKEGLDFEIQVDGSCNKRTFKRLTDAGAELLVVGSSGLFNLDPDVTVAWDQMLSEYNQATGEPA